MSAGTLLAIDVGGTKTAIAVVDRPTARVTERATFPTGPTGPTALDRLLCEAHRLLAGRQPIGIGLSFGGHVVGRTVLSLHVPGWEDTDLIARLEHDLGAGVRAANDAEAGAIGEHTVREAAGQACPVLVYVTVSTGIGGAVLLEGAPFHGSHGLSGEIGHMVVDDTGVCSCGRTGHLEAHASGLAIARRALAEWPGAADHSTVGARDVARAAQDGDAAAQAIIADAGRLVGRALANTALLVDPDLVVVGGGVALAGPTFWEPLVGMVDQHVLHPTRVEPARHGSDSALMGAVELARTAAGGAAERHRGGLPSRAAL